MAGTEVAKTELKVKIDQSDLTKQINDVTKNSQSNLTKQLNEVAKKSQSNISKIFKPLGKLISNSFSVESIINFTKSCIALGSGLNEAQNLVNASFKTMSGSVNEFASTAIDEFGLSEKVAKSYMGTIGAMNNAFGFTEKQSLDMAKSITGLTGDVASLYNLQSDEVFSKMQGIWTGQTDSLKSLGVVMTQTALDEYALNQGLGKTTAKMTEQEKVMLRYQYVTDSLSTSSGDFIRTQGGWANQTKILQLRFESFKTTLGQGFINLFLPIVKAVNVLLANISFVADAFKSFTESFMGVSEVSSSLGNVTTEALSTAYGVDAITEATQEAKRELAGFDKINKLGEETSSVTSGGDVSNINTGVTITGTENVVKGTSELAESIIKALEPLKSISFDNLKTSLSGLITSLSPLTSKVWDGLKWGYDNILVPLAKWTIEDLIPAFIDVLSGTFDVLNSVLDALEPLWTWVWDNFFEPIAKWTGGIIVGVLDNLSKALQKISDWIKDNEEIVQGMAVTIGLFAVAWEGVKLGEFLVNIGGVTGGLKKLTDVISKHTIGIIKDKIETAKIVGLYAKDFVVGIAKNTTAFVKNAAAVLKDKIETAKLAAMYAKDFVVGIAKTTVALIKNIAQWVLEKAALIASTAATIAHTVASNAAAIATTAFGVAMTILTSPITLIIAGIALLVGAIYLLIKNWDTVKEVAAKVWDGIVAVWNAVADWFKTFVIEPIANFFIGLWEGIKAVFSTVTSWFMDIFTCAWEGIKFIWSFVIEFFSGIWNGIVEVFSIVITWFGDLFASAWEGIKIIWSFVIGFFSGIWNGIVGVFSIVITWFGGIFSSAWEGIKVIWSGVMGFFGGIWEGIKGIFSGIANWFKDIFTGAWEGVKNVFSAGGQVFSGIKDGIVSVFKTVVNALIGGINTIISTPFKAINGMLNKIRDIGFFGIKPFSWIAKDLLPVPQIPELAQGGYVKANTPQLAMIGDNRHQGEIVAPEDKLRDMAISAVNAANGNNYSVEVLKVLKEILEVLKELDLNIVVDGKKLKDVIVEKINQHTRQTGVCEIIT